jgi:predicted small lipoprotein YifL
VLTSIALHSTAAAMRRLFLVCLLLCLNACGAKGALYLPDEKAPAKQQNKQ